MDFKRYLGTGRMRDKEKKMNYKTLQFKADYSDANIIALREGDKIQKEDFLELGRDNFVSIDEGSPYIGKTVQEVHTEIGMWVNSRTGSAFKRRILRLQ